MNRKAVEIIKVKGADLSKVGWLCWLNVETSSFLFISLIYFRSTSAARQLTNMLCMNCLTDTSPLSLYLSRQRFYLNESSRRQTWDKKY